MKAIKKYERYFGRRLKIFITERVFDDSCTALRNTQKFTGAEENIINIYEGVRVNSSSKGGARPIIRMGSKVLRYLGAEKIVHEVKKQNGLGFSAKSFLMGLSRSLMQRESNYSKRNSLMKRG